MRTAMLTSELTDTLTAHESAEVKVLTVLRTINT